MDPTRTYHHSPRNLPKGRAAPSVGPRRAVFLLSLLGGLTAACGGGPLPEVNFPWAPPAMSNDPSGAVVLESEGTITFRPPKAEEKHAGLPLADVVRRERWLMTGDGGEAFATWALEQSGHDRLVSLRVRLARPNKGVVTDKTKTGNTKAAGERLEVKIPTPKKGDVIDVLMERTVVRTDLMRPWVFAERSPTAKASLRVVVDADIDVRVSTGTGTGGDGPPVTSGEGAFSVQVEGVPAVGKHILAANAQRNSPWALITLQKVGAVPIADTWDTVVRRVLASVKDSTVVKDDLAKADLSTGLIQARLASLRRILKVRAVDSPLTEKARDFETIKEEGGTELELAAIALGMSSNASDDDKAYVALATGVAGAVVRDDVPGLYAFERVLVAHKASSGWSFVDLACENCAVGVVPAELAGGRALILNKEQPTLAEIPSRSTERSEVRLQYDWTVPIDGAVTGKALVDLKGSPARRYVREHDGRVAREVAQDLVGANGPKVMAVTGKEELVPERPLALELKAETGPDTTEAGKFVFTVLALMGRGLPVDFPTGHRGDIALQAPVRYSTNAAIVVPPGFQAVVPAESHERFSFGDLQLRCETEAQVINCTRRVGLFAPIVEASAYDELMTFVSKITELDQKTIVLKAE